MAMRADSNKSSLRRCKRLEKLMSCGLLVGYAQRVKACFEFLDIDNTGHFTLKDITERGRHIAHDLGVEVESSSSFAVMDAFRSFDISGRGRVRLEEFAIALAIRFQKFEFSFFEELANAISAYGINSVSRLLHAITNPELEGAFTAAGETDLGYREDFPQLPDRFHESFRAVYYLLQHRLKKRPDNEIPPEDLARILKDTYIDASRELRAQLHLPLVRIKAAWRELKGKAPNTMLEGLEEDLEDSMESSAEAPSRLLGASRRRQSNLFWKPPKKMDYGASRRMSFEMTQASSLKAQARRSSSILASSGSTSAYAGSGMAGGGHALGGGSRWGGDFDGGMALGRAAPFGALRFGSGDIDYMAPDVSEVSLSPEQAQMLSVASKCIENYLAAQIGRPYDAITDEELKVLGVGVPGGMGGTFSRMRAMSMLGSGSGAVGMMRRDSYGNDPRFSVLGGGMGYRASMLMNMQQMGDMLGHDMHGRNIDEHSSRRNSVNAGEGAVGATVEAELSQELMETQDKLRRTLMRLEVLELIQLQVESLEEEAQAQAQAQAQFMSNDDKVLSSGDGDGMKDSVGNCVGSNSSGSGSMYLMQPVRVPENVAFEDIMDTAQELRVLVSKRGMDSMLVGSLLNTPSALLPLQDVEDRFVADGKESLADTDGSSSSSKHPGENSNPNSPLTPSASVRIFFSDKKKSKRDEDASKRPKKIMQTTALIASMETTAKELSDQFQEANKLTEELNKLELLRLLHDEKTAEYQVMAEQEHRAKEGAAAVAVEVQVLRDRIHTVDFVEREVSRMKTKNVELGRRAKQLERELIEAQEERDFGKVDGELQVGAGGFTLSEEQVMKLKDELADLRSTNNRLLKEQQHRGIAAKHAEQRLKMCLQDNLALHQKLNRVEEDLNSSRTEVSDLLGQIEHQRDIEEERLQVARKLHSTEMLVTELRGNLLEARAEAVQAGKLREELTICESRVAKLMAAASEAEVEGEGRLSVKQEVEELRAALQQKTRENRDLTIQVRSLERKSSEVKSIQARLEACQDEVNRYKVRVEQSAPMLAEVARLRGASRAAVRSLQEQDKIIATLEENNKLLRGKVAELTERTKTFEGMEVRLADSETECSRLSDIVSNDIPLLTEKLKSVQEERRQLEIQCRHIKKTGRQFAIAPSGLTVTNTAITNGTIGKVTAKPSTPHLSSSSSESKK